MNPRAAAERFRAQYLAPMCGRFTLARRVAHLFEQLAIDFPTELAEPRRYNVAPGQPVLAVVADPRPRVEILEWGFIPTWSRPGAEARPVINARAESLREGKPYFRGAFRSARCAILADGFYEWKKQPDGKHPYRITVEGGDVFAMAGLWSAPHLPDGAEHLTCAIVTVPANDFMRPIHDRMPAILRPDDLAVWLDPTARERDLYAALEPWQNGMAAYEVGAAVNNPRNDRPELIEPIAPIGLFEEEEE